MGKLIVYEKPVLSQPSLIIGFDGWPNAAGVSTGVVTYLIRRGRLVLKSPIFSFKI
jgi:hypothetical protein